MDLTAFHGYRVRLAANSVARALALSLAVHLVLFGTLELSYYLHLHLPEWLRTVLDLSRAVAEEKKVATPNDQETPTLTFVEVDPSQATAEPPKDTKNYSVVNSRAANPDVSIDPDKAKIDGAQDKVPKIVDTLRPAPPQPPKPEPQPLKSEPETKPTQKPGDLALARPAEPKPKEEEKPKRPRTLTEAQLQRGLIPGQKLKQEGGVQRHGTVSFDARRTEFSDYDAAIIRAVSQRWYDILDATATPTRPGKVALEFRLHSDGRVSELKVLESDVGDALALYCQKAISDPSPYAPWPSDMRRTIAKDYRLITFTFYYEF